MAGVDSQKAKISILKCFVAVIALLAITEISVRLSGITDFPIYAVDNEIGYIVKPNQSGMFLNKNSWAFNSKSMPTAEEWNPSLRRNILLIGNSIVMGGNPYEQKDKLAAFIASDTGDKYSIWPVAAGGWTNINEAVYLRRNPDVVKAADFFVWEYMSGGLSGLSLWRGDYVFPSAHPASSGWYAFRRYIVPRLMKINMNELPPVGDLRENHRASFEASIAELSKASGSEHPGLIFTYPTRQELLASAHEEWLPERDALKEICRKYGLVMVDVAKSPLWNASLYRDGVHPTVAGNALLAKIISDSIADTFLPSSRKRGNFDPVASSVSAGLR
ncbi:MAG: hypothetical protein ACLPTF_15080 [Steroidobacteraceae bacterium]